MLCRTVIILYYFWWKRVVKFWQLVTLITRLSFAISSISRTKVSCRCLTWRKTKETSEAVVEAPGSPSQIRRPVLPLWSSSVIFLIYREDKRSERSDICNFTTQKKKVTCVFSFSFYFCVFVRALYRPNACPDFDEICRRPTFVLN